MKSSRRGERLSSKCIELKIPCACTNHVITQAASICHTRPGGGGSSVLNLQANYRFPVCAKKNLSVDQSRKGFQK